MRGNATAYEYWFNMRKYTTPEPSMTVGALVKIADASPLNQVYQDMFGKGPDVALSHGMAVDMTRTPHFYCVPAATMCRGIPE